MNENEKQKNDIDTKTEAVTDKDEKNKDKTFFGKIIEKIIFFADKKQDDDNPDSKEKLIICPKCGQEIKYTKDDKNKNKKPFWRECIETIVFVAFFVIVIRGFICEPRWIPSASMRPTLLEGDRVLIEKMTFKYNWREIQRGDILVFHPPMNELIDGWWAKFTRFIGFMDKNDAFIKRVVGLPGDKYEIKTNKQTGRCEVYINGTLLKETYLYEDKNIDCKKEMFCKMDKIPDGYYLMLGDNRANSLDGRFWGLLPKDRIIGRAIFQFRIYKSPEY